MKIFYSIRKNLNHIWEWLWQNKRKDTISFDELNLYRTDPVLKFIRNLLRLNWWRAFLFFIVLWAIDSLLYSVVYDLFEPRQGIISFRDDIPGQIMVVAFPGAILLSYYVWVPKAYKEMIIKLKGNRSFKLDNNAKEVHSLLADIDRLWNCRLFIILPLVFAVLFHSLVFIPFQYPLFHIQNYWWDVHSSWRLYFHVRLFFFVFVIARIVIMELLGVYSLNRIIKSQTLVYQPFHTDRACGLLPIGQYRLGFIYGLASLSVFFLFVVFQRNFGYEPIGPIWLYTPLDVFLVLFYILMFPLAFLLPVYFVHQFMKNERNTIKNSTSLLLSESYNLLISRSQSSNKDIRGLYQSYVIAADLANKFPIWPYNTSNKVRAIGVWSIAIFAPAMGNLLSNLIQLIFNGG